MPTNGESPNMPVLPTQVSSDFRGEKIASLLLKLTGLSSYSPALDSYSGIPLNNKTNTTRLP